MKQLTVKELHKILGQEIKKGNGDKLLITADDMEGNGYHGMWFGATPASEAVWSDAPVCDIENDKTLDDMICIG